MSHLVSAGLRLLIQGPLRCLWFHLQVKTILRVESSEERKPKLGRLSQGVSIQAPFPSEPCQDPMHTARSSDAMDACMINHLCPSRFITSQEFRAVVTPHTCQVFPELCLARTYYCPVSPSPPLRPQGSMTGKAGVASAGAVVEQDKGFPRGLQDATLENSQGPGTDALPGRAASGKSQHASG